MDIDARLQALKSKLAIYEFISSHPLSADISNATYTQSVNLDNAVFDCGPTLDDADGAQAIAARRSGAITTGKLIALLRTAAT